jgi:hypothetical protein
MNTTLNDIITKTLKGRSIVVYEYDAEFIYCDNRRVSHWYLNNTDEDTLKHYELDTHWKDLQIKKHIGIIVSVTGYYMDYEGTSISMVIKVDDEDKHISINMEDTIELMDGIKQHTMV